MEQDMEMALEYEIAALLAKKQLHVVTAESCTGGLIAGRLVNVAGISEWFDEGYVTYSNQAKQKLLGVSSETLRQYGAVSEQTAGEMARGAAAAAGAQAAIAVTGIAGPQGGTPQKPVGLVYIGCCCRDRLCVKRFIFAGDRAQVRSRSVQAALTLLRDMLLECEDWELQIQRQGITR